MGRAGTLDDGLYGLSFAGPLDGDRAGAVRGDGLAVLRAGRILGSDRHGGVFKGHCRYDEARGEAVVEIQLAVPPNGVLLTGLAVGPEGAFVEVCGRFPVAKPVSSGVIDVAGVPIAVELRFVGPLSGHRG